MISLKDASERFTDIMQNLNNADKKRFLTFVLQEWKPDALRIDFDGKTCRSKKDCSVDDPVFWLNSIAEDIRKDVPFSAILPSENIVSPKTGENSDCNPDVTLHVDEFLYDEDDVNDMVQAEKLKKYYCVDCGSKNIKELIFISHSMSRDALYHIFNNLLPTLEEKTILDVGSRLGTVLYGAYVYTDASKIIGVEMNKEFCELQQRIVDKYHMSDRIEIMHSRIEEVGSVIQNSDVIIINNAFEFYASVQEQVEIWKFLKNNIKRGTILVTRPQIDITLGNLPTEIDIAEWLKPLAEEPSNSSDFPILNTEDDKFSDIDCYEVR